MLQTRGRRAHHRHRYQRVEVGLDQRLETRRRLISRGWLSDRSAVVAQDRRVDSGWEALGAKVVWVRSDPVVVDALVRVELEQDSASVSGRGSRHHKLKDAWRRMIVAGTHDKGVTLSCEYLDGVDGERLGVHAVSFDDCHVVLIDAEDVVWIARHGHEAEPVTRKILM